MNDAFVMDSLSHTVETHCYRTASGSDRMLQLTFVKERDFFELKIIPSEVEQRIRSLPLAVL